MPPDDDRRASDDGVLELPFARFQEQTIDWLELAQRRHAMYCLLEVDVSAVRSSIRARRRRTGRPLAFNAYLVACLARAIDSDKRIAAVRHGRRRLLVFSDVDIALPVESDVERQAIPVPHIVRRANHKSPEAISEEISQGVEGQVPYASARRYLRYWLLVPAFLRRLLLRAVLADARRRKRLTGTALVTAVGLPGRGRAWGVPSGTNYPVTLVIGGLRLGDDGRQTVALTLAFDHDTVNGSPAARFVRRFARLVESGELINQS